MRTSRSSTNTLPEPDTHDLTPERGYTDGRETERDKMEAPKKARKTKKIVTRRDQHVLRLCLSQGKRIQPRMLTKQESTFRVRGKNPALDGGKKEEEEKRVEEDVLKGAKRRRARRMRRRRGETNRLGPESSACVTGRASSTTGRRGGASRGRAQTREPARGAETGYQNQTAQRRTAQYQGTQWV